MSEQRTTPGPPGQGPPGQGTPAQGPPAQDPPARNGRSIPPLVWIVVALLVVWLVVALMQRHGTHVTPQGGTAPQATEGPSTMPAAPGGPGVPATPAGTANGPNQPPAR